MKDLTNPKTAIKALEASVKANQIEFGNWLAPRALNLINRSQKKPGKSMLVQTMQLFREVGAWDESLIVGEMARQLDPSDNDLANELKNLSAQRAMDQGGYTEAIGEEGGFRKSIKDVERQKELIEEESISGGGTVDERNLMRARIDYEKNPTSPDAINRYAQLIKKQGTPEAEQQAYEIYMEGFNDVGEYRFRRLAGDIKIEQLERRIRQMDELLEANSGDSATKGERESVKRELLELQSGEYAARVAQYPTDRFCKFDLGRVQYELGNYDDAMAQLQASKDEPKLRVRAGHLLGRCFLADEWFTEAVAEFEEAIGAVDATEKEYELPIKYDLMIALLDGAREEGSMDMARDAKAICSEIARKDITYRDIRAKRKEVDQVIKGFGAG